ncbi:glycosyltransferase [Mesorhizobium sp. BH1-1-5]|uniref:glycosyltransferase family 2 protein n=1 Tax=Mesorhizobium sp. BH1-1-5 TaxID=2876661 RepID=UPI001CCBF0FE|nr:glycosyltransferase [Mesorhizobium sp. BH1-1-5]MBZ9988103.1 glycosyltransferase [Mesorhizobium sp. BH1-1-5]
MTAISIIIPAHNAAATIADTLTTLRSEAEVIGEVILVDDCSTDGTATADAVALKIARVHYARGDLETAAKFLAVAEAAPKASADIWRCLRYRLKIGARRRFPAHPIQLQRA